MPCLDVPDETQPPLPDYTGFRPVRGETEIFATSIPAAWCDSPVLVKLGSSVHESSCCALARIGRRRPEFVTKIATWAHL